MNWTALLLILVSSRLVQPFLQRTCFFSLQLFSSGPSFLGFPARSCQFLSCTRWSDPVLAGRSLLAGPTSRTHRTSPRCRQICFCDPRLQNTIVCFWRIGVSKYGPVNVFLLLCSTHVCPGCAFDLVHHGLDKLLRRALRRSGSHGGAMAQIHDNVFLNVEYFFRARDLQTTFQREHGHGPVQTAFA